MFTLKCFWAGFMVAIHSGLKDQEVKDKLEELKQEIKSGTMKYSANGSTFVLTELCVDVFDVEKFVAMYNFKL